MPSLRAGTKDLEERNRREGSGGGGKAATRRTTRRQEQKEQSPLLIPRARVVSVSSAMHHYGASLGRTVEDRADPQLKLRKALFSADRAYGRSKLAQLLFARELRRRTAGEVDSFGLHPGMVVTDVVRSLHPAIGAAYRALMGRLLLSPDEGARASVFAAAAKEVFDDGDSCWYLDANARPTAPCAAAECPETAQWLWRWSAEAVGLKEGEDLGVASSGR
jgi:NAD(P)-dependent dehydrogenase (short-subunit alcohol dehydrogenase family)